MRCEEELLDNDGGDVFLLPIGLAGRLDDVYADGRGFKRNKKGSGIESIWPSRLRLAGRIFGMVLEVLFKGVAGR